MAGNPGQKIYNWINDRLDEGLTVYVTTYTKCTKIQAKHSDCLRVNGSHCEITRGRNWDSINFCKITAS